MRLRVRTRRLSIPTGRLTGLFRATARHLGAIRGRGRRGLITFGSVHKGCFLRRLRQRGDVRVLEVAPFLEAAGTDG